MRADVCADMRADAHLDAQQRTDGAHDSFLLRAVEVVKQHEEYEPTYRLYSYGIYSYGLYSYGLNIYGLHGHGRHIA